MLRKSLPLSLAFFLLTGCPGGTDNKDDSPDDTTETGEDTAIDPDSDGDGINDSEDNCDDVVNEDQADLDEDLIGDACDPDVDGDNYDGDVDDCDDTNPNINPAIDELCADSIDNDCDGEVDEDDAADAGLWYPDADADGYGDMSAGVTACDTPADHISDGTDCDDSADTVNPAADEVCDTLDNNCDGQVDEEGAIDGSLWYADTDGDLYGDSNNTVLACEQPEGYTNNPADCDDNNPDLTNGLLWYPDADSDGYGDPQGASTFDCVGPSGTVADSTDCNDADGNISPGAAELCDGVDNDCDGQINCSDFDCAGFDVDNDADGIIDETCEDLSCITGGSDGNLGDSLGSYLTDSFDFDGDGDATSDSNVNETNDFGPTCRTDNGGLDVAFLWEAPADGCYQFDTNDSSYDTILYLQDSCNGTELACDDDSGNSTQSLVEHSVTAGESVVVIVDGYSSSSAGNYEVNIDIAPNTGFAEDFDLGTTYGDSVNGLDTDNDGAIDSWDNNSGYGDTVMGDCLFSGVSGEDIVYLWEAPSTECWIIDSNGSAIDTYIAMVDYTDLCYTQTECDLASGDDEDTDGDGTVDFQSAQLELQVDAGEAYYIVVDAQNSADTGEVQLNINPLGFAHDIDLGTGTGTALDTSSNLGQGNSLDPSCSTNPSGEEIVYLWEAPVDGCWLVDTDSSAIDTTLTLLDNSTVCPVETDCDTSGATDGLGGALTINALAGEQFHIVADAAQASLTGSVQVNIDTHPGFSDDGDLASLMGSAVISGLHSGTEDRTVSPTCGGSTGGDNLFTWTAPGTATYTFTTFGSSFDTVLSLHESAVLAGCTSGGVEYDCNDDTSGLQSEVSYSFTEGDEVIVRLGGYSSTSNGTYTMDIFADIEVVCDPTDLVDDDNDGLVDCADTDCANDPACVP